MMTQTVVVIVVMTQTVGVIVKSDDSDCRCKNYV